MGRSRTSLIYDPTTRKCRAVGSVYVGISLMEKRKHDSNVGVLLHSFDLDVIVIGFWLLKSTREISVEDITVYRIQFLQCTFRASQDVVHRREVLIFLNLVPRILSNSTTLRCAI